MTASERTIQAEAHVKQRLERLGNCPRHDYRTGMVADVLGVTGQTVRNRIKARAIPATQSGPHWYITHEALVEVVVLELRKLARP